MGIRSTLYLDSRQPIPQLFITIQVHDRYSLRLLAARKAWMRKKLSHLTAHFVVGLNWALRCFLPQWWVLRPCHRLYKDDHHRKHGGQLKLSPRSSDTPTVTALLVFATQNQINAVFPIFRLVSTQANAKPKTKVSYNWKNFFKFLNWEQSILSLYFSR